MTDGSDGTDIPVYIGYAALCLILLAAGTLGLTLWFLRRRRAATVDTYSSNGWNRYVTMFHGLDNPSPAAVRLQRSLQNRNGITLDELNLVAPVKRFGMEDESDAGQASKGDKGSASLKDGSTSFATIFKKGNDSYVQQPQSAKSSSEDGKKDAAETTCAICLEEMEVGQKTRQLPCMHQYHSGCVEEWVTKVNRCPICSREPLEKELVTSRRNARSTRRRGIDAAISRQRRRRTRNEDGRFVLSAITYSSVFPSHSSPNETNDDVPDAPIPPPPQPGETPRAISV